MPWPMVHFAVAVKLSFSKPSPELFIGSISPDAIHARDPVTRAEKGLTHWMRDGRFPSLESLKTNYMDCLNQSTDAKWRDFAKGYCAHIYTDIRWTETLYADFEKRYAGDPNDIRDTYNKEVSQVEFDLLRSAWWADEAISKLRQAQAYAMEPLVTKEEVSTYREIKIGWLQDSSNEPGIITRYFIGESVALFIENTADELIGLFHEWDLEAERSLHI
ncbi:hypothetical protein [Streptomyces sp. NPDC056154]|uniref:hypothetical protein n=1 Tax=Streptomyces sp. NPDC056154 TaxID=3345729 RepID=UPI0035D8CD40